ncbi:DUF2069 domain-containing protein [Shewanella sp. Choline-02u-19]|jgi:uncharacterized membrane protein|uniref:DUF2069 domain-containing protein n=1 Tax=unclassified Shewanella TaxID=196818 RepID=UPI000C34F81D|nr:MULTISPECIES: DUF2069 domain-containing protein [unclassified Shewanella]PKG58349.1 DUF2069 domain-containing protein [Shewanella sp. GutDb-MelDb]PKG73833.1 DUF2069 domain-containing protein [Shewanella sp. GutCb]PKH56864.1 DUF2069 domain-containing protein [Shewanella sp. Bg11-22]PKI27661.1 DUF2069 domain-containing protein [Shewanella sp. Choline-02u-19]
MESSTLFTLCRAGYVILVILLGSWFIQQGMSGEYSMLFSLLWLVPLLLPLKGILTGKPYTYAWASFILCLYMLHALTLLYVTDTSFMFALTESLLIGALLIGFPFYARIRGRELGLGLKKKKK